MRSFCLLLMLLCVASCAPQKPSFDAWLAAFKQEALQRGISQQTLDRAFEDISGPSQDVLDRDKTQPESTRTFSEYAAGVVSERKIESAKSQWQSHRELLARVEAAYGVPAPILLALWGVESNFGKNQGSDPIVASLSTLAYDGRRSALFREQLIDALMILQDQPIEASALTGSWAGAMGEVQFMPSSYLKFAVDFDGDGKKDIWNDDADALASMANYLHQTGWNPQEGWGVQVRLPAISARAQWSAVKDKKPLGEWQRAGFRLINGADLPVAPTLARLVIPDVKSEQAFLVFPNYDVLLDWNHSSYFASSVGLLADAINTP